jgi:predicted negative regulator of RcsB-dependent stress response
MNSKTSGATSTEQMLNQTELGSVIAKNKNAIILIVALLIVAVLGYAFYNNSAQKGVEEKADVLTAFKKDKLKLFSEDKLSAQEVLTAFGEVENKVGSFFGLAPLTIELADELAKKGKASEAVGVLTKTHQNFSSKGHYIHYLLAVRLAALNEDQGNFSEAAKYLEGILSAQIKIMEDKVRLDLARVYFHGNDKTKAKLNIDYVIEKGSDNKMISLARAFKLKYQI